MRCGIGLKALTLASAVFAFLCILFPVVLKAINDANRPLMCYQCWAARNLEKTAATNGSIVQGVWDRPWCLSEQTSADIPVDTVVCQPSERYCGIYYHERKDLNRGKKMMLLSVTSSIYIGIIRLNCAALFVTRLFCYTFRSVADFIFVLDYVE